MRLVGGFLAVGLVGLAHCGARTDLAPSGGAGAGSSGTGSSGTGSSSGAPDSGSSGTTTAACKDAVLGTDPLGASGLAVDGADVYWSTVDGKLMKSSLDGPGAPLAQGLVSPNGVGVFGDTVYFTEQTRVMSVPKAGGATSVVATGQSLPMVVVADEGGVWWLNYGQGILAGSLVHSRAGGMPETIMDQIDTPSDLAMDRTHLYLAAALAKVSGQIVMGPLVRVPKPTGAPELLAQNLHQSAGVTVDAARLYWLERVNDVSSFPGRLRALPTGGGAPLDLASTGDRLAIRVAVDEKDAYVTGLQGTGSASHGVLVRVGLGGGAVTELARTNGTVYGAVAVTKTAVYWTLAWSQGAQPPGTPSVRKICK
jgi:hypothetical protein